MADNIEGFDDLEGPICDLRILTRHVLQFVTNMDGLKKLPHDERDTVLYLLCDVQEKVGDLYKAFYIAFEKDAEASRAKAADVSGADKTQGAHH
jgi:hypothetical protein